MKNMAVIGAGTLGNRIALRKIKILRSKPTNYDAH
jgi:hypothetical protein